MLSGVKPQSPHPRPIALPPPRPPRHIPAMDTQALSAAPLPPLALAELRTALAGLDHGPTLTHRIAATLGSALGGLGRAAGLWGMRALSIAPHLSNAGLPLAAIAQSALSRAFDLAILNLPATPAHSSGQSTDRSTGRATRAAVIASGAAGGAAGLLGFAPDAAVTTLAIMRRIARIAQEEDEDLSTEPGRRACLEVFALNVEADGGYYQTRLLLQGGPLLRLLSETAARYGVQLGQKLAAQAVPVAGAVCGAAINALFLRHYERTARAHFTIRRLERTYGADRVRAAQHLSLRDQ